MQPPRILAFSGSTRSGSFNTMLVRVAAEAARSAGAQVTVADLRDLALPLFDQDLEGAEGLPLGARKLKALMRENDGLIIASPEYNSSITGVLKNAVDWASRAEAEDEAPLSVFRGKAAVLLSASPGALGGLRGLVHLRAMLSNMGVIVLPDSLSVPAAHEAFDEAGQLKDERKRKQVDKLSRGLTDFLVKHRAA